MTRRWLFILILCTITINKVKANHLYGGSLTYKMIDSINGLYQITLKLNRPCFAGQLPSSLYLNVKKEDGTKFNFPINYQYSIFKTNACSSIESCNGSTGETIEERIYRATIMLGKNMGTVGLWFQGMNRAYSNTILAAESSLLLHLTINTNYYNTSALIAPNNSYYPVSSQKIKETYQILDMDGDSIDLKITNSYIDTTPSIYYPLEAALTPPLSSSKPIFIQENQLFYNHNTLQYTPSQVYNGWINTLVKEYRKIKLNQKDTNILISQYNLDRYLTVKNNENLLVFDRVSSSNPLVTTTPTKTTICLGNDTVCLNYKFIMSKSIQALKDTFWFENEPIQSIITKTIITGINNDTLNYSIKIGPSNIDLTTSINFQFNICTNNNNYSSQYNNDIQLFNYSIFEKDTYLSCKNIAKIPIETTKNVLFTWGQSTPNFLTITTLKDTWIYGQFVIPNAQCPSIDSIYLHQGSIFTTAIHSHAPTCAYQSDGSIKTIITGTNGPYTIFLDNIVRSDSIIGLSQGIYILMIQDKDGCTETDSIVLSDPDGLRPKWNITTPISCFGMSNGAGYLSFNGTLKPSNYLWYQLNSTDSFLSNLSSNTYSGILTYTNQNNVNCTQNFSIYMMQPQALTVEATTIDNACYGQSNGTIALNASGGNGLYTYHLGTINAVENIFNNLTNGNYIGYVTDQKNCTSIQQNITLKSPDKISYLLTTSPPSCIESKNGQIAISDIQGGLYPYLFKINQSSYNSNSQFNHLDSGSYTLSIIDNIGCQVDSMVFLPPQYSIKGNLINTINPTCYGDSTGMIFYSIENAFFPIIGQDNQKTFESNSAILSLTQLQSGIHLIHIEDANKCTWNDTIILNTPDPFIITKKITPPTCYNKDDGAINIQLSGAHPPYKNIKWDNISSKSLSNVSLSEGIHIFEVQDSLGCIYTDSNYLPLGHKPIVTLSQTKPISCPNYSDGTIIATVDEAIRPIEYKWNLYPYSTNSSYSIASIGINTVTIKDSLGCETTSSIQVLNPKSIEIEEIKSKNNDCPETNNGEIQIFANFRDSNNDTSLFYSIDSGKSYVNTSIFKNLTPKLYQIFIKNNNQCVINKTVNIATDKSLEISNMDTFTKLNLGNELLIAPKVDYGDNTNYSDIYYSEWNPKTNVSCPNCIETIIKPNSSEQYTLSIHYGTKCILNSQILFEVSNAIEVYIPNAFSPNGDMKNDQWGIYGNHILSAQISITDRLGQRVFTTNQYQDMWDGKFLSRPCEVGIYMYHVSVKYLDQSSKTYFGSLNLLK